MSVPGRTSAEAHSAKGSAMIEPRTARAVFLDKDGTLIHDVPYNVDPERIALLPGVGSALRRLQEAGYLLFVV